MSASRPVIERGLLPLLDIALMLLGLMIVVTVAKSEREAASRSVWAGDSVVLLELGHEGDAFRVYAVDPARGLRRGTGHELADCGRLVAEVFAREERVKPADERVLVILRGSDLMAAPRWGPEHAAALRDALAGYRWQILWGR